MGQGSCLLLTGDKASTGSWYLAQRNSWHQGPQLHNPEDRQEDGCGPHPEPHRNHHNQFTVGQLSNFPRLFQSQGTKLKWWLPFIQTCLCEFYNTFFLSDRTSRISICTLLHLVLSVLNFSNMYQENRENSVNLMKFLYCIFIRSPEVCHIILSWKSIHSNIFYVK